MASLPVKMSKNHSNVYLFCVTALADFPHSLGINSLKTSERICQCSKTGSTYTPQSCAVKCFLFEGFLDVLTEKQVIKHETLRSCFIH